MGEGVLLQVLPGQGATGHTVEGTGFDLIPERRGEVGKVGSSA